MSTRREIIAITVALFVLYGSYLAVAQVKDFTFVSPQKVSYWSPPPDFGEVAQGWEPPPGYEKTEKPWAPPEGFSVPPETWQPPQEWGQPREWDQPEKFKGKIIREKAN